MAIWPFTNYNWLVISIYFDGIIHILYPIGSMHAIYGKIYHQYTPNVTTYNTDSIGKWGKKHTYNHHFPMNLPHKLPIYP